MTMSRKCALACRIRSSSGNRQVMLSVGGSRLRRDRDSKSGASACVIWIACRRWIRRSTTFSIPARSIPAAGIAVGQPADRLLPGERALDPQYLRADLTLGAWRADLGVRREDNDQRVVTQDPFTPGAVPAIAHLEGSETLPSATLTWGYSDNAQLRLS